MKDIPSLENYGKSIDIIKTYLERGDSYQVNFTQPKQFRFSENPFYVNSHVAVYKIYLYFYRIINFYF